MTGSSGLFLLTLILALPRAVCSWTFGTPSRFGVVLKSPFDTATSLIDTILAPYPDPFRRSKEMLDRSFTRISPQFAITETEQEIKITLDVPGVKAQDIDVTVEDNGTVLKVSGHREMNESTSDKSGGTSTSSYKSEFSQRFSLDSTVDADKLTANLANGVLVITAPKDIKRIEEGIRKIAITEVSSDSASAPSLEEADKHHDEASSTNCHEVKDKATV